ncbi:MAG: hypothetical protein V7K38_15150 [Nostoc sp.]|uniref:hypothetical protein n=1 Tax=Nostoc sp. TaxID=1180 RepID=UPI002FFC9E85
MKGLVLKDKLTSPFLWINFSELIEVDKNEYLLYKRYSSQIKLTKQQVVVRIYVIGTSDGTAWTLTSN